MSEKIADDYGLTQLLAYLKAHAYTGGTNGTFALATDSDMDAVLATGESTDWTDKLSLKGTMKTTRVIGRSSWPTIGICNYVHVPGNSILWEYFLHTIDEQSSDMPFAQNNDSGEYVPYFIRRYTKKEIDKNGCYEPLKKLYEEKKARYDAYQATYDADYKAGTYKSGGATYDADKAYFDDMVICFVGEDATRFHYRLDDHAHVLHNKKFPSVYTFFANLNPATHYTLKFGEYLDRMYGRQDVAVFHIGGES